VTWTLGRPSAYEFIPSRTKDEYITRRPALHVMRDDFDIKAYDRRERESSNVYSH